eukprot:111001_1
MWHCCAAVDDINEATEHDVVNTSEHQWAALKNIEAFSPYALNDFITALYLKTLPMDLKTICMTFLGKLDAIDLQYPFPSTILTTKEKYSLLTMLHEQLKRKVKALQLLYRASTDSDSAQIYHTNCDHYNDLVYIIQPKSNTQYTKLPVFGAFTSLHMSDIEHQHRDSNMFLFRIRAFPNLKHPNVYHSEHSFHYHLKNYVKPQSDSFIAFGSQKITYLFIGDHLHWRQSFVGNDHLTKWMQHTMGSSMQHKERQYFKIKEMEVFHVEHL